MARAGYRLDELARRVGGSVVGDPALEVRDVATLDLAGPHELSFLTNAKYRERARSTRAGAILVQQPGGLEGRNLLVVDQPYLALARLLELFHPQPEPRREISPLAHVAADAKLGRRVRIAAFAVVESEAELADGVIVESHSVVGPGCRIGADSELRPHVVLYPGTWIGARCLIHSGVVLGADGFGFATSAGQHHKVPQLGRVVLEDDVEIGANSAVDRGTLGETRIGSCSKIDDLVMIAHGVQLGPGALLAAQSGIAGSTTLGARTTFAGQSGAAGHLEIGEGSVVAAKSAVFDDLPPGSFVAGVPALPHQVWKRSQAIFRRLPELRRELRELRRRMDEMQGQLARRHRKDEA